VRCRKGPAFLLLTRGFTELRPEPESRIPISNALTQRHPDVKNEFYDKIRARGPSASSLSALATVPNTRLG
jgi:hypothetical protein